MLLYDSFNAYASEADVATKWILSSGGGAVVPGRNGNGVAPGAFGISRVIPAGLSFTAGVAYWVDNNMGGSPLAFYDLGRLSECTLRIAGDGRLYFTSSNMYASKGSKSFLIRKTWNYIEFSCSTDIGGATFTCEVRINGELVLTDSISRWAGFWSPPLSVVQTAGLGGGNTNIIDDFYVHTGGFLGDMSGRILLPNADGDASDWVPLHSGAHFDEVKEAFPDYDTTVISSDVVGDEDLFSLEAAPSDAVISGVQAVLVATHDEEGSPQIMPIYQFNGVAHDGPATFDVLETWRGFSDGYAINPETGNPFTVADLAVLQLGARRAA